MNRNGEPRTSERRLAAADRQRHALELRKAGHSFERIAAHLGYRSKSAAYDAVQAGLRATLQEPADAVRALELERCDRLQAACWPAATQGDIAAVAAVLRIMERRARYLGLDAPHVVDVSVRLRVLAAALGLDPEEAVAEAERLVRDGRHHAPPA